MEIGPDKTKMMTNNLDGFQRDINIKGERLHILYGSVHPHRISYFIF